MPIEVKAGRTRVIVPGAGGMERGEIKDILDKVQEVHQVNFGESNLEQQVEERSTNLYRDYPSTKLKLKTGYFNESERREAERRTEPNKRQL